ncbi:type II toxin-antitoxin system RelE/ParE family toxin [Nocardioides sp. YIM 152588]|uniref:type II toxin-antitoxin system RelE/ParE family toxin n=1 Tax=Nocardioides sp. YIM 152588 TaxID=3158259 RepID=UPI0032E51F88
MSVRLTRLAIADLEEAVAYVDAAAGTGDELLDEVDPAMERLELFPHGAPPVDGVPGVRRAALPKFPFGIYYRAEGDELTVLRVLRGRSGGPQPE